MRSAAELAAPDHAREEEHAQGDVLDALEHHRRESRPDPGGAPQRGGTGRAGSAKSSCGTRKLLFVVRLGVCVVCYQTDFAQDPVVELKVFTGVLTFKQSL